MYYSPSPGDQEITCVDCQTPFTFTERDQQFYTERGFTPPKRCLRCRRAKKARISQARQ